MGASEGSGGAASCMGCRLRDGTVVAPYDHRGDGAGRDAGFGPSPTPAAGAITGTPDDAPVVTPIGTHARIRMITSSTPAGSSDERPTSGEPCAGGDRPRFAHLHLHSEYSLLDGGNTIDRLIEHVRAEGMEAVAVTDHGNLFGAVEFYTKAKAAGIKPILGIEAYVAPEDRRTKRQTGSADGGFHLVLLAEDQVGWEHLLKLSSDSFLTGFYRKPRMDKETLARWSDGLIAINGHLGSSIAHHLVSHAQSGSDAHWEAALEEARWHAETFRPNERGEPRFFVELQRHDVDLQLKIDPHLIRLARELELPLVGDNDAHFLRAEDWDHHDTLCCISMGKTKTDPSRLQYSRDLWVKGPALMAEAFADVPEAVENANRIAERCDVEIDFDANHAPVVRIVSDFDELPADAERAVELVEAFESAHAAGSTEWLADFCSRFSLDPVDAADGLDPETLKLEGDGALRLLAEAGAVWRYGPGNVTGDVRARLDRELRILADKLISAYFLICWDFVNWARQNGIPANARGSGVGTMVGYVLGLSNACPVRYGLLFERFTDPDRSEYPDIDIDICQDGRGACIEYVRRKYGHVAQIITFGRLKARAAIKDVARVHGLPPAEGQRLANLVPDELNIRLDDAVAKSPDLAKELDQSPIARTVFDAARALEDHARHAGIHAAGIIVATRPLDEIVPLCKPSAKDEEQAETSALTQWDGPTCERVGLLKLDFLGLRTLSTIERCRTLVRESMDEAAVWRAVGREAEADDETAAHPLDLERLRYDDQLVLDLFRRGDTAGVFQFESAGMRKLLTEMKPDRLEDLIAANALYRPGPMDLIPDYCARKHGRAPVPSVHAIVDEFTAETYGIMVYQEQVMQIVHGLGGIPLRSAYTLIKAISKKKHAVIDANRPTFIEGAKDKGLSQAEAEDLFDLILKFAGYGFNKSHSTGYAIIAYQTAYLKTYFPNQYMAAVLTYESAARKVDDWVPYLGDCKATRFADHTAETPHAGVDVRPPCINRSERDFAVVFGEDEPRDALHGHVRFGLQAIRNVGRSAIEAMIDERRANGPFESIFDFCERVPGRSVPKSCIEALVAAGAFDAVHGVEQRSSIVAAIDEAVAAGQTLAQDRAAGQMNMFDALAAGGDDGAADEASSNGAAAAGHRPLPTVPAWDRLTTLAREKEVLGFHVSGHPLDEHADLIRAFCDTSTVTAADRPHDAPIAVGGLLSSVRTILTRKDSRPMALLTVEDGAGSLDGVVFPRAFAEQGERLRSGSTVILIGRHDASRNEPQIVVEQVIPIEEAAARLSSELVIDVRPAPGDGDAAVVEALQMLRGLLGQAAGHPIGPVVSGAREARVVVRLLRGDRWHVIRSRSLRTIPAPELIERLEQVVGPGSIGFARVSPQELLPPARQFRSRSAEPTMAAAAG